MQLVVKNSTNIVCLKCQWLYRAGDTARLQSDSYHKPPQEQLLGYTATAIGLSMPLPSLAITAGDTA